MRELVFPPVNIPVHAVSTAWLQDADISLSVLRADLLDPLISGNKYFKLKYNLQAAAAQGKDCLLSFGGPWSNHLHALAAAGQHFGFATIGVVRGEEPQVLNDCLRDARNMGMQLHFISRDEYRRKEEESFQAFLMQKFGKFLLIPEGGANREGIRGCQELAANFRSADYSHILLACGTGTTMTGVITSTVLPVIGIQVLKGERYLQREIAMQLENYGLHATAPWQVMDDFHCGGYARCNQQLLAFMKDFAATGIPLEPVYSGKLFLAIHELVQRSFFPPGSKLLAIHGGGLQGARGYSAHIPVPTLPCGNEKGQ